MDPSLHLPTRSANGAASGAPGGAPPSPEALTRRLSAPGPKRILALDGGGIRGIISLGFLARIEALLREQSGNPELVLSDYFDLIGGTSTGALLATAFSLGWPVERAARMYRDLADIIFRPRRSVLGPLAGLVGARFDQRPLEDVLHREIGDLRLDSPKLRTGLVVVAKRADTASVWQLTNVPGHRFYEMNRHLALWELLRASSAAPTFFEPQRIRDVGDGNEAVFVDGGVSMHTNPALQMFMVASLEGFGLQWPLGEERILLCSVGTGGYKVPPAADSIVGYRQLQWMSQLMVHLLQDASDLGQTLLQWMSRSPTARPIDRQIGDLSGDLMTREPLLTYLRYDVSLAEETLAELGLRFSPQDLAGIRSIAGARHVGQMEEVGKAAARWVEPHHFAPVFAPGAGAPA